MTVAECARECAQYVYDSDCEQEEYEDHIANGNDPREHILYMAAVVLGYQKDFKEDIQIYKKLKKEERASIPEPLSELDQR